MDFIKYAKEVFDIEIDALERTKESIDDTFGKIAGMLIDCRGKVLLCGIGKSGHIARKIAATFSSLGTPSFFLHPAEALHGDLGMVSPDDVVVFISNSGECREIIQMLPSVRFIGAKMVAITSQARSTIAEECDCVQVIPRMREACALDLAPTSSTTAVLVYGDALAVAVSASHGFTEQDFALFHPAGALGRKMLIRVKDIMAKGEAMPVVKKGCRISDAVVEMSRKGLGVVIIEDGQGKLAGILTDGDLRRAIERKTDMYNGVTDHIMTGSPKWITGDILAAEALRKLKEKSLNNYPVVDEKMRTVGVVTWQMIIKNGIVI